MRSIRVQLLGWLLPGFVVVCVVAIIPVSREMFQMESANSDIVLICRVHRHRPCPVIEADSLPNR